MPAKPTFLLVLLLGSFCFAATLPAEVVLTDQQQRLVETLASRTYLSYPIDRERKEAMLDAIDRWADAQIRRSDANLVSDVNASRTTWAQEVRKNRPIEPLAEAAHGLTSQGSFRIKYVQESRGRALAKSLRVPTTERLEDQRVADLGRRFLERSGFLDFLQGGDTDQLEEPLVVARVTETLDPAGVTLEKRTILQRAVFGRSLNGLVVLNSRQIVDVHPDTGEVLAYKSLDWFPVSESGAEPVRVQSASALLASLRRKLDGASSRLVVDDVTAARFQLEDRVVPILAFDLVPEVGPDDPRPPRQTVCLPLDADLEVPARPAPRRPTPSR